MIGSQFFIIFVCSGVWAILCHNNSRVVRLDDNSCWVGLIVAQIVLIKPHSNGGVSGKARVLNFSLGRQSI